MPTGSALNPRLALNVLPFLPSTFTESFMVGAICTTVMLASLDMTLFALFKISNLILVLEWVGSETAICMLLPVFSLMSTEAFLLHVISPAVVILLFQKLAAVIPRLFSRTQWASFEFARIVISG